MAIATDEPLETNLPQFGLNDYDPIAEFVVAHLGLREQLRPLCSSVP